MVAPLFVPTGGGIRQTRRKWRQTGTIRVVNRTDGPSIEWNLRFTDARQCNNGGRDPGGENGEIRGLCKLIRQSRPPQCTGSAACLRSDGDFGK